VLPDAPKDTVLSRSSTVSSPNRCSFEMSGIIHPIILCHIPDNLNPQKCRSLLVAEKGEWFTSEYCENMFLSYEQNVQ
jgi:hypothetical protein